MESILADHGEGLTAGELAALYQHRFAVTLAPEHVADIANRSNCIYCLPFTGDRPSAALKREALTQTRDWHAERSNGKPLDMDGIRERYQVELSKLSRKRVSGNTRAFVYLLDFVLYGKRRPSDEKPVRPRICVCGGYHNETVPRKTCRHCGRDLPPIEES